MSVARLVVGIGVMIGAGTATADPSPSEATVPEPAWMVREEYPVRLVDRPLVIQDGTMRADVTLAWITQVHDYVDSVGIPRHRRTNGIGLDLAGRGATDGVEIGLGVSSLVHLDFSFALSDDATINTGVGTTVHELEPDDRYLRVAYLGGQAKVVHVPRKFALVASAAAVGVRARIYDDNHEGFEGFELDGSGGLSAQFQFTKRMTLVVGPYASVPLTKSEPLPTHGLLNASITLAVTSWKWDFFVGSSLNDLTHTVGTAVSVGFAKRWPP